MTYNNVKLNLYRQAAEEEIRNLEFEMEEKYEDIEIEEEFLQNLKKEFAEIEKDLDNIGQLTTYNEDDFLELQEEKGWVLQQILDTKEKLEDLRLEYREYKEQYESITYNLCDSYEYF